MATFVLVHGAWHGGWCWRRVADRLTVAGHRVFAPTLTGLADRSHLAGCGVDLSTHIADVVNLIRWEKLTDVVLCGHSYGGFVISGVADTLGATIASLVYLDAFYPADGDTMTGARVRTAEVVAKLLVEGATAIPPIPAATFNVNAADRAYVDAQCTPQPIATFTQKIALSEGWTETARKIYVRAEGYESPPFDAFHTRFQADPAWTTHGLPCGHDVMLDEPDALTAILLAAV
jgi:pimeloyl-ACP methyl ester carboxylesterase